MSGHPQPSADLRGPALQAWPAQLQDASFDRAGRPLRAAYPPQRRITAAQPSGYPPRRTYALASSTRPTADPTPRHTFHCLRRGVPVASRSQGSRRLRSSPYTSGPTIAVSSAAIDSTTGLSPT